MKRKSKDNQKNKLKNVASDADDGELSTTEPHKIMEPDKKKMKPSEPRKDLSQVDSEEIHDDTHESDLLKMQIKELVDEILPKKKLLTSMDRATETLKGILLNMPVGKQHDVFDTSWLTKSVHMPIPDVGGPLKANFMFRPPKEIHTIGSILLGTSIKPDVHVDILVEIPTIIFRKEDFLNHRYFRKKALYISCIARHLKKKHSDFVQDLKFTCHHGNYFKPVLVITAKGESKKSVKIHLHVAVADGYFKLQRFNLTRSNVRRSWFHGNEDADDIHSPTPFYNNAILEDLTIKANTEFLNRMIAQSSEIRRGICLLKVWLHQRELSLGLGGCSGFIMSMYVAYLLHQKKINILTSSLQLMKNTLAHLIRSDWTHAGISLSQQSVDLSSYHDNFEVVFLDVTANVNICATMSKSTFQRVKDEATMALRILDNKMVDGFDALLMSPVPFRRKFDQIFHIDNLGKLATGIEKLELHDKYIDTGGNYVQCCLPRIMELLSEALDKRISFIQSELNEDKEWDISESPPGFDGQHISIGIMLNREHATSIIEKGPLADSPEASKFRDFWGEKSELRRFQDGSICEAVAWPGAKTISNKRTICYDIVKHILKRHMGIKKSSVRTTVGRLDQYIHAPVTSVIYGTGEEQHFSAIRAFDELSKILRDMTELPLSINTIQGSSAVLRFTEVFPPMPLSRTTLAEDDNILLPTPEAVSPTYMDAIKVVCTLESSGQWPDDSDAILRLKAAFNLKVCDYLEEQQLPVAVTPTYIDVVKDGLVFRLVLTYNRELAVLRTIRSPDGMVKMEDTEQSQQLELQTKILPKLTGTLYGVQQLNNCYSGVARLAKRWISSHLLADHIEEEAVDLLVAYIFVHPEPFVAPGSAEVGFWRFLYLMSSFDWKLSPIIINLNNEFKDEEVEAIHINFSKQRDSFPLVSLFTPFDQSGSRFTTSKPNAQTILRIAALAKESLKVMDSQMSSFVSSDLRPIFHTPLGDYDILIHLRYRHVPRAYQAVNIPERFKMPEFTDDSSLFRDKLPVVDFDPVQYYLKDLRESFDELALFFHDRYGGSTIAVLWKPQAFKSKEFAVQNVNCRKPTIISSDAGEEMRLVPNVRAILKDFKLMGQGIVLEVVVQSELKDL